MRQRRGLERKTRKWGFPSILVSCPSSCVNLVPLVEGCSRARIGGKGCGTMLISAENLAVTELE